MVTLAQRIQELRDEKGLSRPALASALGFPRQMIEKFETGQKTPTKDQMDKMAAFFGVSLFYLKGESNDRTRMETWMDSAYADDEPVTPPPAPKRPAYTPAPRGGQQEGSLFDAFLSSKTFQDSLRATVLDVLRSPEGQEILARTVRKELSRLR